MLFATNPKSVLRGDPPVSPRPGRSARGDSRGQPVPLPRRVFRGRARRPQPGLGSYQCAPGRQTVTRVQRGPGAPPGSALLSASGRLGLRRCRRGRPGRELRACRQRAPRAHARRGPLGSPPPPPPGRPRPRAPAGPRGCGAPAVSAPAAASTHMEARGPALRSAGLGAPCARPPPRCGPGRPRRAPPSPAARGAWGSGGRRGPGRAGPGWAARAPSPSARSRPSAAAPLGNFQATWRTRRHFDSGFLFLFLTEPRRVTSRAGLPDTCLGPMVAAPRAHVTRRRPPGDRRLPPPLPAPPPLKAAAPRRPGCGSRRRRARDRAPCARPRLRRRAWARGPGKQPQQPAGSPRRAEARQRGEAAIFNISIVFTIPVSKAELTRRTLFLQTLTVSVRVCACARACGEPRAYGGVPPRATRAPETGVRIQKSSGIRLEARPARPDLGPRLAVLPGGGGRMSKSPLRSRTEVRARAQGATPLRLPAGWRPPLRSEAAAGNPILSSLARPGECGNPRFRRTIPTLPARSAQRGTSASIEGKDGFRPRGPCRSPGKAAQQLRRAKPQPGRTGPGSRARGQEPAPRGGFRAPGRGLGAERGERARPESPPRLLVLPP
ncbi:collagen alpha-1(I) chain-like [Hippopotamus amphibius kiboko]|uniref:collagen alpha-1(I) chain-like n=1 Tax=Hippopotamus amphibius kiboko TaxID=575201 RepID=UPI002596C526|nr:collagen alpha-1(I) chain-like [Hippopotamus amphibius kiboko]